MKRWLLAGVLLLAVTAANRAIAADMPVKLVAAPPPVPEWGWTEFYFGLNIGGAMGQTSWCTDAAVTNCQTARPIDTVNQTLVGVIEGGQFGYRWQIPNSFVVVGIEGLFDGLTIANTSPSVPFPAQTRYISFNNLESVTGQVGIAWDRLLLYGKGGWASTELDPDANNPATGADLSIAKWKWVQGFAAGGGLEYQFWTHFSLGVEYTYYQFDVGNVTGLTNTLGVLIPCDFCNFGRTSLQTIVGRVNIKLWPWGP